MHCVFDLLSVLVSVVLSVCDGLTVVEKVESDVVWG